MSIDRGGLKVIQLMNITVKEQMLWPNWLMLDSRSKGPELSLATGLSILCSLGGHLASTVTFFTQRC